MNIYCLDDIPEEMHQFFTPALEGGREPTFAEHIAWTVAWMREVRRVLRDDGVVWFQYGDGQASSKSRGRYGDQGRAVSVSGQGIDKGATGLREGNLIGMAWALAFALRDDGWYLRQCEIWAKGLSFKPDYAGSVMPESVHGTQWVRHLIKVGSNEREWHGKTPGQPMRDHSDSRIVAEVEWADCPGCPKCAPNDGLVLQRGAWRCTQSHEYLFLLAKSRIYFADGVAVREAAIHAGQTISLGPKSLSRGQAAGAGIAPSGNGLAGAVTVGAGRNLRSVWVIGTGRSKSKTHFATFPEALVEPAIKAGTSERGACPVCGACWARVVRKTDKPDPSYRGSRFDIGKTGAAERNGDRTQVGDRFLSETIAWRPTCDCRGENGAAPEPVPALVLDPFAGSGTTLAVAERLGRHSLGIDLAGGDCDQGGWTPHDRIRAARGEGPPIKKARLAPAPA